MSLSLNRIVALAGCALLGVACAQDPPTAPALAAGVGMEAVTGTGSEAGTITLTKVRDSTNKCFLKVALKGLYDDPNITDDYYLFYFGPADKSWGNSFGAVIEDTEISPRGTFRGQWMIDSYVFSNTSYHHYLVHYPNTGTSTWLDISGAGFKFVNRCF